MHPYANLPAENFWRRFVSDTPWRDLQLAGAADFRLNPDDRVASAGSCFAQHIARHMKRRGLKPFQVEFAHPLALEAGIEVGGFDEFSARYGNIYTSRQGLELFQQATGLREVVMDFAEADGRHYDLLRPNAVPHGFASYEECAMDRLFHLSRVKQMFEQTDVFVFTLGLTERWYHRSSGHTYPVCPGTARGVYQPEQHLFGNLSVSEVVADLVALIEGLTAINPRIRLILTVSPVPLVATYTQQNVLLASVYSKSVLRAACGEIDARFAQAHYFPSYEIISHPASFGQYLQGDLREVTERGVSHVMDCFFNSFYGPSGAIPATAQDAPPGAAAAARAPLNIEALLNKECEEMFNDVKN